VNKKKWSRLLIIAAVLIIVCPFILEYVFHVRPQHILSIVGVRCLHGEYWFFIAGGLLFIAFYLQFPFREEEAWHCECGYDLSYLNKKSKKCPECGKEVQLEWSSAPETYSRKTTQRIYWAMFLFAGSIIVFALGFLTRLFSS
jgi:hypothetical protein